MSKLAALLAVAAVLCRGSGAFAQEYGAGFSRFLGYNEDRARFASTAEFGDRGPFLQRQQLDAARTVRRAPDSAWVVSGRAAELGLGAPRVVIPQSGVLVPRKLWTLRGGAGYRRELGERRRWGASASLGSASDRPFLAWREDEVSASAYYQLPGRARDSWIFLLNYSNNRPFANNIPLPGLAYQLEDPDHDLSALVGFPFLYARWRPAPPWTLSAGVFGFAAYFAQAERRLSQRVDAYARFERTPLQWLRADRSADDDRLIFDSKEVLLGARAVLGGGFSLEVSAGRVFDRRFFEARDARRSGGAARAALSNAAVLQAALTRRWGETASGL